MQLGYTMMTEQAGPKDLVGHVVGAEAAGFDFAVSSDHYFPWLDEMGHSPYAWVTLGAAAQATSRIPLMTYVTCPTFRYHPAVVAQKAATLQILSDGRFTLGLGAGENLNEHIVGGGWPARRRPPGDAGRGHPDHPRAVRRRRLHQLPRRALRRRVGQALGPPRRSACRSASPSPGEQSCDDRRRARRRDDRRRAASRAGRDVRRGRRRGQAADRPDADQLRHRQGRGRAPGRTPCSAGSGCGWKVNAELPGPPAFDAASQFVREEDVADAIPCGDDVDAVLEAAKEYADAGFTHLALVQIGGDQQVPFIEWSEQKLMPAWRDAFGD